MRFNKSKGVMSVLSLLAATVALGASTSFAAGAQRVDVIDCLPMANQTDSMSWTGDHAQRVDVIDTIGTEGPVHLAAIRSMRVDIIDRLGPKAPIHGSTVDTETMSMNIIDSLVAFKNQFESAPTRHEKLARVDVIGNVPARWQWDSWKTASNHLTRVDVIDDISGRGPLYPSTTGTTRVDLIDEIRS